MSKKKQFLVSLLKSMYDTMPETISLDKVYQLIILETFRSDTEKHRYYKSAGQKKEAQSVKDKMMNFTPSVILAGGKAGEHVTGYTGLGMADFDHVPPDDLERCFRLLDADCPAEVPQKNRRVAGRYHGKPLAELVHVSLPAAAEHVHGLVRAEAEVQITDGV